MQFRGDDRGYDRGGTAELRGRGPGDILQHPEAVPLAIPRADPGCGAERDAAREISRFPGPADPVPNGAQPAVSVPVGHVADNKK